MSLISLGKTKKELTMEQRPHFHSLLLLALRGREDTHHQQCDGKDSEKPDPAVASALSLCEEKAVPLDQRNSAGETPVFYAAARCFSCFLCLVNHGVNPVTENTWGVSNLNQATQLLIENGDNRVLEYLIQNKCYPIDKLDDTDQTILHQASKANSPSSIRAIIQLGADVNQRDSHHKSALFIACAHSCYDSFDTLIELGAKYSGPFSYDDEEETLLHVALSHPLCSRKLLKRLIFMDIPLKKKGCKCRLSKKTFCKDICTHLHEYAFDKYQEFCSRKGQSGPPSPSTPDSSPRQTRSPFRFWRSSSSIKKGDNSVE